VSRKGTVIADMKKLKPDELSFIVRAVLESAGYRNSFRGDVLQGVDFEFIQQGCGPCTRRNRLEEALRQAIARYQGDFVSPRRVPPTETRTATSSRWDDDLPVSRHAPATCAGNVVSMAAFKRNRGVS